MKNILLLLSVILLIPSMIVAQNYDSGFEDYFVIERVIELEQNEESLLTSPMYSIDENGEILAADVRLNEVKMFDSDGFFIGSFGREGRGPGEFMNLISAIRLDDGHILTADVSGRLTLFSGDGEEVLKSYNTPVIPLMGIEKIENEKVLIYGRGSTSSQANLIHVLDMNTKEIVGEFLEFNFSEHSQILRMLTNISVASVSDNHIVASITPFLTFYFHNTEDHTLEEEMDYDLNHFREISNEEISENQLSLNDITRFSWIERVEVVGENKILIQYVRWLTMPLPGSDEWRETEYSLALINTDGELLFDINNSPKLIDYNREKDKFYFIDILRESEEYDVSNIKSTKLKTR